jgi:hypothetical protein
MVQGPGMEELVIGVPEQNGTCYTKVSSALEPMQSGTEKAIAENFSGIYQPAITCSEAARRQLHWISLTICNRCASLQGEHIPVKTSQ